MVDFVAGLCPTNRMDGGWVNVSYVHMKDEHCIEPLRPNHTYYQACHGAWRGRVCLRICDGKTLRSALGLIDVWSVYMIAYWPRWFGRFYLYTTVDYDPAGTVLHTTTIRWLGMPLLRSVETLTLDEDGKGFVLQGVSKSTFAPWRRLAITGNGDVDSTSTQANYQCTWLGTTLHQATHRTADVVTLRQEAPGLKAIQTLHRQTEAG